MKEILLIWSFLTDEMGPLVLTGAYLQRNFRGLLVHIY